MKKFKFSLDVLLKIRNAEKKKLNYEIYEANQQLIYCRQELEKVQAKQRDGDKTIEIALKEGIPVHNLKNYNIYRRELAELSKVQVQKIGSIHDKIEQLRDDYITLKKELDMLDKLKKQQLDIYRYNMAQEQMKEIEDILSYKTSRGVQYGNIQ